MMGKMKQLEIEMSGTREGFFYRFDDGLQAELDKLQGEIERIGEYTLLEEVDETPDGEIRGARFQVRGERMPITVGVRVFSTLPPEYWPTRQTYYYVASYGQEIDVPYVVRIELLAASTVKVGATDDDPVYVTGVQLRLHDTSCVIVGPQGFPQQSGELYVHSGGK